MRKLLSTAALLIVALILAAASVSLGCLGAHAPFVAHCGHNVIEWTAILTVAIALVLAVLVFGFRSWRHDD